jgi:hypothetical protein
MKCTGCGQEICCCKKESPESSIPIIRSKKKYRVPTHHITNMTYEVEADSPEQAKADAHNRSLRRLLRGRVEFQARVEVDTPQEMGADE